MEQDVKQVNRFIVMCVEQYAACINQNCSDTYYRLNETGIIKELEDDYEDMHGMSIYLVNEYIHKRLGNVNQPVNGYEAKIGHVISKTTLIYETIELIADEYTLTFKEARNRFYQSKVIDMLDDDETGLYGESALYLLSLYEQELYNILF